MLPESFPLKVRRTDHATRIIPCLRPSFHPSIPCKNPCPKRNATQCPVRTVPVNKSWSMPHAAVCDAMRDAPAPFPSTPRYASCCALTPAGEQGPEGCYIRQDHSLSWYTKGPPCEKTISRWGRSVFPAANIFSFFPPPTSKACPHEVA